jgi:ElaB/YqjD/DUF883 family membrane-anchored ribosome-binding protein
MNEMTVAQREKLAADLRAVVADAEELLKLGAGDVSESARSMRERVQQNLSRAKDSLSTMQATAVEKARAAGHAADDYVHENPWRAIAVGAGAGLVIGLLIGRR